MIHAIASGLGTILNAVYPPQCVGCEEETTDSHGLCPTCWKDTSFISGSICNCCGLPVPLSLPTTNVICDACMYAPPGWDNGRAAILYEGTGKKVVLGLKHRDRLDLALVAAGWMAAAGRDLLRNADVLAPVPLHWSRLARRRHNQSAELARQLSALTGVHCVPDLLIRQERTTSLEGKNRAERFAILQNTIRLNPRRIEAIAGRKCVLIDDVLTTGATLGAATSAVRTGHPAGVSALVLARVARDALELI
ncbi:ComF family protein [Algicella marina]|uniref:ComF family protein n=1 Tax=Algicella marina TaxID=2683284 RepID=A0A6P1T618_9RHOB|nr:ComF family protein [Algicella marina]QHQ36916.1 ComF family protein [Algicella marina]